MGCPLFYETYYFKLIKALRDVFMYFDPSLALS